MTFGLNTKPSQIKGDVIIRRGFALNGLKCVFCDLT